ncbi:hypothetical protein [Streptomyces luteogriseus]|uniref:hypothetical protein n=1 Tax=Streptomyces luteogriseus TaxID=68233 RepID=UPI0037AC95AE
MPRNTRRIVSRKQVRFAPVDAVQEYIHDAPGQVLACRDTKHAWKLKDIEGDRETGFVRYYRCACKATLIQTIDANGFVVGRRTKYPKGYQMPAGTGRLDREGQGLIRIASAEADLRAVMMRKAMRSVR